MKWSCDGSPSFTLEEADKTDRGTSIVMHIDDDCQEFHPVVGGKGEASAHFFFMSGAFEYDSIASRARVAARRSIRIQKYDRSFIHSFYKNNVSFPKLKDFEEKQIMSIFTSC